MAVSVWTVRVFLICALVVWQASSGTERLRGLINGDDRYSSETRKRSRSNPTSATFHLTPSSKNSSTNDALTIIVQLSGELGNHLQKIGHGLCVQYAIENELGIPTEIKLLAQERAKWQQAMESVKAAFDGFRSQNFRAMNTPDFDRAHNEQRQWMHSLIEGGKLDVTNITDPLMITDGAGTHFGIEDSMALDALLKLVNQTWNLREPKIQGEAISTPHVYTNSFMSDYCLDLTYHDLRAFFRFDEAANCKAIPYPNETVLHLRNFVAEMPRRGMAMGFEEIDETRMATELFADHEPGDNVAIVSRMDNNVDKYVKMLETRGFNVRYIRGQTGNQDFCFLAKAQKEIIGSRISTYAYWAGIVGDARRVRLYSLDTPRTRSRGRHSYSYSYTNPELRERISFENY